MRGKHKRMDYQEGSLPPSISTPRRESGSLCPYVGCVDSQTVVSLQEPRMFLRDEAHKSSPTECSPVHVVSPSPVSWVPEVRPSSEKTASEKRYPGTAFRPGWEKLFTGSKASEPPAEKKKPYPGDLPDPGIESRSPTLQADSLPSEPPGKPKNTGVGCHSLLQRIFPTQGSNPCLLCLLHWQDSLPLRHLGIPLSFPTRTQTHVPCTENAVLTIGLPGKSHGEQLN